MGMQSQGGRQLCCWFLGGVVMMFSRLSGTGGRGSRRSGGPGRVRNLSGFAMSDSPVMDISGGAGLFFWPGRVLCQACAVTAVSIRQKSRTRVFTLFIVGVFESVRIVYGVFFRAIIGHSLKKTVVCVLQYSDFFVFSYTSTRSAKTHSSPLKTTTNFSKFGTCISSCDEV